MFRSVKTEQTFDQVAREHGAMIKRIACSYEADAGLAEELVQEIHLAIWRALPAFRGAASLRTFAARIATNRAVTHVVRRARSPATLELGVDLAAPEDDPEKQAIASNRQVRLLAAVRSLPLAYRQVASLTLEGLSPKDIAESLGVTVNAVAVRMTRARDLLRQLMGEDA